ncbi:MAG: hypothetical protein ACM3US_07110 [Sphingomonadaceae bacterium]
MSTSTDPQGNREGALSAPMGGIPLRPERLAEIAREWQATAASLRRMDELKLGEIEPATLFVWEEE